MTESVDEPRRLESTELYEQFEDENEKATVLRVFDIAKVRLVRVDELYHDFSSHGMNHALRTIEILSYLLSKCNIIGSLTHSEVFLLICATLVHDIGMGPIDDTEMADFINSHISSETKTAWRKDHHNRSRRYITESQELSFIENDIRRRIGDIARGHREVNLLRTDESFSNPVDCFLAASLRLSDQMDLSSERVQERLITRGVLYELFRKATTDMEQTRLKEFLKNFADKKWKLIFLEELPVITLDSEIPVDELAIETLDALEGLVNDIEETLEEVKDVPFQGHTVLPHSLHYAFRVQNEASRNHVLRAHLPRVWEYLNMYLYRPEDRPWIAVREALANAIDSCIIQMNIDSSSDCIVHVKHLKDRIVIEDNGTGMSLRTIEEHLKVLGSSYYDSPSFKSKPSIQRPVSVIGQFGIGVFSYLLICNHFEIVTTEGRGSSFRVLMSKRFGVTIEECSENRIRGTILTLFRPKVDHWPLDDSKNLFEIIQYLYPRPKIKVLFEDHISTKEICLWRVKPEESIQVLDGQTRIRFITEDSRDRLEYGIQLDLTIAGNSPPISNDDVIQLYHAFSTDRESSASDRLAISALFEGMHVSCGQLQLYPFTYALLSLALLPMSKVLSSIGMKVSVSMARVWLDIPADHADIDLPKKTIILDQPSLEVSLDSIEEVCKQLSKRIMLRNEVDWVIKERLRWAFITRLLKPEFMDYDTSKLIEESVIENFIAPLVCVDGNSRDYITFGDVLESPPETRIVLWAVGNYLPWAFDDKLWRQFRIIYALDYFRGRNRVQSVLGGALRDIKKAIGTNYQKWLICLIPIGDSIFMGALKNLEKVVKRSGHKSVRTHGQRF